MDGPARARETDRQTEQKDPTAHHARGSAPARTAQPAVWTPSTCHPRLEAACPAGHGRPPTSVAWAVDRSSGSLLGRRPRAGFSQPVCSQGQPRRGGRASAPSAAWSHQPPPQTGMWRHRCTESALITACRSLLSLVCVPGGDGISVGRRRRAQIPAPLCLGVFRGVEKLVGERMARSMVLWACPGHQLQTPALKGGEGLGPTTIS